MSKVFLGLLVAGSVIGAIASFAGAACDTKQATRLTKLLGSIDSVAPCGGASGTGSPVAFTATASFHGVGFGTTAERHTVTVKLLVLDEDGQLVCSSTQSWDLPDAEHGCYKCPVTCNKQVDAGVYFINATMTDIGPDGKKLKVDAKSCAVIVSGN